MVDNEAVLASCHGIIRGLVRYHPASAIHSAAPAPHPTNPGDITVGRFTSDSPKRASVAFAKNGVTKRYAPSTSQANRTRVSVDH